MALSWLIETGVFPDTAPRIIAALERRGITWCRYHDDVRESALPPPGEAVLFWGSLGAAYVDRVAARWTPGAVGDIRRFHCSSYYPHLRGELANGDALFTTVRELVSAPATQVAPLGRPERVFVRPDSPLKPFSGRVVAVADLSPKALDHGYYYDDEDLPIVVAPCRQITAEWRFVVVAARVVAGSAYTADRAGANVDIPGGAREIAARVAGSEWQAASMYVVDVGLVDDAFRLLELNPFSGADFYHGDADAIVDAVTAALSQ